MNFASARLLLLLLTLMVGGYALAGRLLAESPRAFLIGDCPYYAAATESLLNDGDWDLANQLVPETKTPEEIRERLRDQHNTQFALGIDGRITLKHSTLLPLLSLPFYAVFASDGLLLFNVVALISLVFGISILGGDTPLSRIVALLLLATSPLLKYAFNLSPDVLGTSLLVWAWIAAQHGRGLLFGVLAGLAVWGKVYFGLFLLPALLLLPWNRRSWLLAFFGGALALLPMLAINWHLFGHPLTFGYDRAAEVTDTGIIVKDHYSRFNQPLISGLGNLLFDGRIGMLSTAPLWLFWPVALWLNPKNRKQWKLAILLSSAIGLNLLLIAGYDEWEASAHGNRFLFPALVMGGAILSLRHSPIHGTSPKP